MKLSDLDPNFAKLLAERAIGSATRMTDIPAQYKSLKVLGRGATSIVLDLDADHVIIVTRDSIKVEWLQHNDRADILDIKTSYSAIPGMTDLDVYVIKSPKLYSLDSANAKMVRKVSKDFNNLRIKMYVHRDPDASVRGLYQHYSNDEKHILHDLISWLMNYDAKQFAFDIGPRNFMQDADGKVIVSDPIVLTQIVDLIHADSARRYREKEEYRRAW